MSIIIMNLFAGPPLFRGAVIALGEGRGLPQHLMKLDAAEYEVDGTFLPQPYVSTLTPNRSCTWTGLASQHVFSWLKQTLALRKRNAVNAKWTPSSYPNLCSVGFTCWFVCKRCYLDKSCRVCLLRRRLCLTKYRVLVRNSTLQLLRVAGTESSPRP